jgi:hypothetical protein
MGLRRLRGGYHKRGHNPFGVVRNRVQPRVFGSSAVIFQRRLPIVINKSCSACFMEAEVGR